MAKKVQYSDIIGDTLANELTAKFAAMGKASIDAYIAQIQAGLKNIKISDTVSSNTLKGQSGIAGQIENAKVKLAELTEMGAKYQRLVNQISMQKLQTKVDASAIGSYNRLNAELNLNIAKLKAIGSTEAYAFQTKKKLTDEIKRQDAELKKLDATMGKHQRNVGNYKSALGGIGGSIMGLVSTYFSLYSVIQLVQNIFENTRTLDSLAFSYKVLIKDVNELGSTQSFLADISEKYGLNILKTSQSYLKFKASIVGTNFSLAESEKLFNSVAKAGAVLGLRSDRMELVFLALEQMISKGTISMEELRRQLGDNLPGAMRIMADALDVTIPELMKLIKANKVLAEDALPKFAVALEKAYGIEDVTKIDTLNAAVGRFETAWINMIAAINASKLSSGVVDSFTAMIEIFTPRDIDSDSFKSYSEELKKINEELAIAKKNKNEKAFENILFKNIDYYINQLGKYKKMLKDTRTDLQTPDFLRMPGGLEEHNLRLKIKEYQVYVNAYEKLVKKLDDLAAGRTSNLFKKDPPVLLGYLQEIEDRIKKLNDLMKASRDERKILDYQQEITNLKAVEVYYSGMSFDTSNIEKVRDRWKEVAAASKSAQILGWSPDRIAGMNDEIIALTERIRDFIDWDKQLVDWQKEAEDAIKNYSDQLDSQIKNDADRSEERMKKFIDDYEDFQNELDRFNKEMGISQEEFYKMDLELLKYDLDTKKITEEQYLAMRAKLWVRYNSELINSVDQFAQEFTNLLDEIAQGQIDAAQKEVDAYDTKLDKLKSQLEEEKKLKDDGKANDYDRLVDIYADNEKLRNEANEKLEKAQKRQAQIQLLGQLSDIATASATIISSMTKDFGWAGAIAGLAEVAALIAAWQSYKSQINSIGESKYAEGTESVEGPGTTTSDSISAKISRKERVVPARINDYLTGISNDELPKLASIYRLNFGNVPDNIQIHNSYDEVVGAIERSAKINQQILDHQKNQPTLLPLSGNKYLLSYGQFKTKVITLRS